MLTSGTPNKLKKNLACVLRKKHYWLEGREGLPHDSWLGPKKGKSCPLNNIASIASTSEVELDSSSLK